MVATAAAAAAVGHQAVPVALSLLHLHALPCLPPRLKQQQHHHHH